MAEERDKYTRSSLVIGINFLFFFLGIIVVDVYEETLWFNYTLVMLTFFLALFVAIGLSFLNRTPVGGVIIGLSLSGSYWIGFLTSLIIKFQFTSNTDAIKIFGPYALYVAGAFSCLGLFFGVLGYLSERLFVENPIIETYVYRDYWSNVYGLGKNVRREYESLDRKLTRAHVTVGDWWRQQIHRIKQVQPDLMYVGSPSKTAGERFGDVYEISSGKGLYQGVVDPSDLIGVYKPSIVSIPRTSDEVGGGRRLAFEELVSRLLGWFAQSRVIYALYLAASAVFTYSLYAYFDRLVKSWGSYLYNSDVEALLITGVALSSITLYFVYRFRSISKTLFENRPDERTMIFAVYMILFMFYGLYYQVITSMDVVMLNMVSLFDIGPTPWIIAIEWFLVFTAILTITYVFIHRECEVSNVYLYDNSIKGDALASPSPYRAEGDGPYWLQGDGVAQYWVLRFMYFWRYELTLIPHKDWERVEVWVDAKTGEAKWIVSDYHYRELWYKVEGNLRGKGLHVGFLANFHTPIPYVTEEELRRFTDVLSESKRSLLRLLASGRLHMVSSIEKNYCVSHPADWVEGFGLKGLAANFCSDLKWCYWRYPWGIDDVVRYREYPSALPKEQPGFALGVA
jgi:hypothetical protein